MRRDRRSKHKRRRLQRQGPFPLPSCTRPLTPAQHFEEIFERSLTVHGFTLGTGESAAAMPRFYEAVTPLILAGKITSREHRFALKDAGEALLAVHLGKNTGKAVVIVSDDE